MPLRKAFSLIELLLALTIGAVVVAASVAFVIAPRNRIAAQSCKVRQSELKLRVEEYYRSAGRFPSANLRELSTAATPLPTCPIDGQPYLFDPATQQIRTHIHP